MAALIWATLAGPRPWTAQSSSTCARSRPSDAAELVEELLCEGRRILTGNALLEGALADAEHDRQKLGRTQALRPVGEEFLARPLIGGPVLYAV